VLRLLFIFTLAVLLIGFMVRSTLKGAMEKKNVTSIYMKIMMNHMQLILLTASFDFDWPAIVQAFFSTAEPVAQVSTQILSLDCFLDNRDKSDSEEKEVTYDADTNFFRIFY